MDNSTTLYLYFTYSVDARPDGYSLYSVDISLPNSDKCYKVNQPQLAVRITGRGRDGMVCAKLGSKFYFLGGLSLANKKKKATFPTDVLVYDPTDPNNSNKKPDKRVTWGKPMNSGKSHPVTFEVNNKLYVLGESNPYGGQQRLENLFEEYDPENDCWKVLEGPPLEEKHGGVFRVRESFVVSDKRVLITGDFGHTIFSFDPLNYKWTKVFKPGGYDAQSFFLKDSFYGVREDGGLVTKLGPCSSIEDGKTIDAPYSELPVEWGPILPSSRLYIDPIIATRAICHLFGRVFCTIVTVSAQIHNDRFLEHEPDSHLRLLNLIIYEEIPRDPSCSKVKCIQQASFSIPTEFNSFGSLSSCYVVTPEEKDKRIQVDEKKIKTDLVYSPIGCTDSSGGPNFAVKSTPKFDIYQIDSSDSTVQAEFTLTSLLKSKSKFDIWSEKHEEWNNDARKSKNGLKNYFSDLKGESFDQKFNFARLTNKTLAVICAMVTGVLDLHAKGISNNYLDNTDNYLFRAKNSVVGCEYDCHFLQTELISGAERCTGMSHDMRCVCEVILKIIGEPAIDFPPDLQHFMDMLERYKSVNWKKTDTSLLRDHPALWPTGRKNPFRLLLSDQNMHLILPKEMQKAMEHVFWHEMCKWSDNWQQRIPGGTPFQIVFGSRSYGNWALDFFGYLRNLALLVPKNVNSQDHKDYEDPDFVEVLICELFPLCMVLLWEELNKYKIFQM